MSDIVKEATEYRIKQIELAEAKYYKTLIATLDRIEQEVISLANRLPTQDGKLIELKNNRLNELLNVMEEIDGKVIIWAVYRYDIQQIEKALSKKYGPDSVRSFYGDTDANDRQDIVNAFQDSKSDLRFFVGKPRTGGFGLTLTASHTVVYYSNSYDLEIRMQSEDRAHRIGQKEKVTYIDFIAEKTVDEKIIKSLRNKINIATKVLGEDFKEWLI